MREPEPSTHNISISCSSLSLFGLICSLVKVCQPGRRSEAPPTKAATVAVVVAATAAAAHHVLSG